MYLLDYDTPDIIQQIDDIGAVALAISAVAALIWTIAKIAIWLNKRKEDHFAERVLELVVPVVKQIVEEATINIQTGSNGGYSLSDMHERMDKVDEKLQIPISPRPAVLGDDERSDLY